MHKSNHEARQDGSMFHHGPRPGLEHLVSTEELWGDATVVTAPVENVAAPEPATAETTAESVIATTTEEPTVVETTVADAADTPLTAPVTAAATGGAGPLVGVFVGNDPAALARHEAWLGRDAEAVLAYTGERDWNDMNPGWIMSQFPDHTLLFSIPLFPRTSSLAEVANGAGNAHFRNIAETIMANADQVDAPDGSIYVRTGWEMGGEWFPWGQQGNDRPDLFIQAFQNFSEAFQGVSDRFKIVWDVTPDRGDTSKFYPGDEYVDVVSQDFYWNPQWQGTDPVQAWENLRDSPYGPAWIQDFAAAHGKQTAVSEWGVPSGYDATAWIEAVADWFEDPAHNMAYQTVWDSNTDYGGMLSDGSNAATGAAYKDAFG